MRRDYTIGWAGVESANHVIVNFAAQFLEFFFKFSLGVFDVKKKRRICGCKRKTVN